MLGTGSDRPLTRPPGHSRALACPPSRPKVGDQISQDFRDTPVNRRSPKAGAQVRLLDTPRPCPVPQERAANHARGR